MPMELTEQMKAYERLFEQYKLQVANRQVSEGDLETSNI